MCLGARFLQRLDQVTALKNIIITNLRQIVNDAAVSTNIRYYFSKYQRHGVFLYEVLGYSMSFHICVKLVTNNTLKYKKNTLALDYSFNKLGSEN